MVCDDLDMSSYAIYNNPKAKPTAKKHKADLLEAFLGALFIDKVSKLVSNKPVITELSTAAGKLIVMGEPTRQTISFLSYLGLSIWKSHLMKKIVS